MRLRRRFSTLVLATFLALGVAVVPASADESGGANNIVLVQNGTDGATLVKAHTKVVPVESDTVTSTNLAAAINTACVGCHSTAVAVQILIVVGSPSVFKPANVAAAANGGCNSCGAYAYARQHFIQVTKEAHLDGDVRHRIAELRKEI